MVSPGGKSASWRCRNTSSTADRSAMAPLRHSTAPVAVMRRNDAAGVGTKEGFFGGANQKWDLVMHT